MKELKTEKKRKRRWTLAELEERREKVFDLRLRGLSLSTIGGILEIDKSMVSRDLKRIQKECKKNIIKDYDPESDVGELLKKIQIAQTNAYLEFTLTRAANLKAGFLNTFLRAIEQEISLKQQFGLMRRVPQEFALKLYDKFDESEYPSNGGG